MRGIASALWGELFRSPAQNQPERWMLIALMDAPASFQSAPMLIAVVFLNLYQGNMNIEEQCLAPENPYLVNGSC